jgi:hypothetical protein
MATHADIGVSQPAASTITMKVATITLDRNSTTQHQELLTLADPETTNALARVSTGVPSTHAGLIVRSLNYQSSQGDNKVTAYQSTATDFLVTASQGGTWNIGTVTTVTGATVTLASSANSVLARVTTSSGGGIEGSTNTPQGGGHLGLKTRVVLGALTNAASTMGSGSTGSTVVSSAATVPYVTAYSVVSTVAGPLTAGFYAGSTLLWPFVLWAEGGQMQAQQAVSAPAYLFKGQADRPIELRISSTGAVTYGITYWNE